MPRLLISTETKCYRVNGNSLRITTKMILKLLESLHLFVPVRWRNSFAKRVFAVYN